MSQRRTNAKGRNPSGSDRVIIVRRALLHSPQFSALSPTSRCLLVELHALFNGTNNGSIFLSCKDAADRLGLSDLKAVRGAFEELRSLGFISETIAASFAIKAGCKSRARAWNLNWIVRGHCAGPDVLPALDFTRLTPIQKRRVANRSHVLSRYLRNYCSGKFAVEDSPTLDARKALAAQVVGEDSTTAGAEKLRNPPIQRVEDSTHHIEYHRGSGSVWWGNDQILSARQTILRLFLVEPQRAAA